MDDYDYMNCLRKQIEQLNSIIKDLRDRRTQLLEELGNIVKDYPNE